MKALALLLFGLAGNVTAQTDSPSKRDLVAAPVPSPSIMALAIDEQTDTIAFSLGGSQGVALIEFVEWAQRVTNKRFTYSAQELNSVSDSKVHFLGTFRFKRDQFQENFFSFFQTMLYIKGFAIVPRGEGDLELLEIVMMTGVRGREVSNSARYVPPGELGKYRYQTGVPILTTVPLQHINAQLANNALRPFFASAGGSHIGGSVQIGNVGNKSALLLQGFGPRVYAAAELLKLADIPDSDGVSKKVPSAKPDSKPQKVASRLTQIVVLEHQDPHEMVLVLNKLLGIRSKIPADKKGPAGKRASTEDDDNTIAFSMTERDGMELGEFIRWAQEVTGKRFTYNTQELRNGAVGGNRVNYLGTFRFQREHFRKDFYAFFQTMLYIKGFAVVPRGEGDLELLEIVLMKGMRGREIPNGARYVAPEQVVDYRYQTGVQILTTVRLSNINAQLANNSLRPFFASTGGHSAGGSLQIGNVGNRSVLLLQGFGPQVYAAVELLKLVDAPDRSVLVQAIDHGSRTAILIRGNREQVGQALDLIARLDVAEQPGRVVRPANGLSEDLMRTLKKFMTEEASAAAPAGGGSEAGSTAARKSGIR